MLLGRQRFSDRLTALFELRHTRQCGQISFEIRRSMGGSVAYENRTAFLFLTSTAAKT